MEADAVTYERAIHSLCRENRRLHLVIAGLNRRIERLLQEQLAECEDRARLVEAFRDVRRN